MFHLEDFEVVYLCEDAIDYIDSIGKITVGSVIKPNTIAITIEVLHISHLHPFLANGIDHSFIDDRFFVAYNGIYFAHKGFLIRVYA